MTRRRAALGGCLRPCGCALAAGSLVCATSFADPVGSPDCASGTVITPHLVFNLAGDASYVYGPNPLAHFALQFTADTDGPAIFDDTAGDAASFLYLCEVATGNVVATENPGPGNTISFNVVAGTEYRLHRGQLAAGGGTLTLNLPSPSVVPLTLDAGGDAILPGSLDPTTTAHYLKYTAPASGALIVELVDPDNSFTFDTDLIVLDAGGNQIFFDGGDDEGNWETSVTTGQTYYLVIRSNLDEFNTGNFNALVNGPNCVTPPPPAGVAATDNTCTSITVSWNAVPGATGYEVWRATSNNTGAASQIATSVASPFVDSTVAADAVYWYWVRTEGPCGTSGFGAPDSGVALGAPAAPSSASVDPPTVCSSQGFITLSATGGGGGGATLKWYANSCGGTPVGVGNDLTIPAPFGGTQYFARWENACGVSACASTTVGVLPPPTAPVSASAQPSTVCPGQGTVTLSASGGGGAGVTLNWYSGACGTNFVGSGNGLVIPSPTSTTQYFARWENACGISTCASTTVTVSGLPDAPTSASANPPSVCAQQGTVTLAASGGGGPGATLRWYATDCGETLVGEGTPLIIGAPATTTEYFARWEGVCGASACAATTVEAIPTPEPPSAISATPPTVCSGQGTLVLNASGGGGPETALKWYADSCGGTFVGLGDGLVLPAPTVTTTYYARWESSCATSTCTSVVVLADTTCETLDVPSEYPTIAAAIEAAQSGDIIVIAPGTYTERVQVVDKSVSLIAGTADGEVILDGEGKPGTLLSVIGAQGREMLIKGITFRNGNGGSPPPQSTQLMVAGAMLLYEAGPTVEECVFENNSAQHGGGVYTRRSAALFSNCTFTGNFASADGGGLQGHNSGLTLVGCTFVGNTAGEREGYGGGAHLVSSSTSPADFVVTDCTFVGNQSVFGGGASWYTFVTDRTLTVNGSDITKNAASDSGGGLWAAPDFDDQFLLGGTTICENSVPQLVSGSYTDLGGNTICADGSETLEVPSEYPTIAEAIAAAEDGDTIAIAPGTYFEHLVLDGKKVSIVASSGDAPVVLDGNGDAGTLLVVTGGQGPETVIQGITFRNSHGGSALPGEESRVVAGALLLDDASPNVVSCVFEDNSAPFGGAVYARLSTASFGGCFFSGNSASDDGGALGSADSGLFLDDCAFDGNVAGGNGGAVQLAGSDAVDSGFVLNGCAMVKNSAAIGGAVHWTTSSAERTLMLNRCLVTTNEASLAAGGMWADPTLGDVVAIAGTTVCDNSEPQLVIGAFDDLGGNQLCGCIAGEDLSDCNSNGVPDSCDIASGLSEDIDGNGVPDECKPDCNDNGLPDAYEIAQGTSADCNANGIPDECEDGSVAATTGDMGAFGAGQPALGVLTGVGPATTSVTITIEAVADLGAATEFASLALEGTTVGTLLFQTTGHDCPASPDMATLVVGKDVWNQIVAASATKGELGVSLAGSALVDAGQCGASGFSSVSVAYGGPSYDCDADGTPDICQLARGGADCNGNGILDSCEIASGEVPDVDRDGVPDTCQPDCNGNGLPDSYEIAQGLTPDCNGNGLPDSCDIAMGEEDCNRNGVPDTCDLAAGTIADCDGNGIPDVCERFADCNGNGVPDSCDIADGTSTDVDRNGVPDECKDDCNGNGLPDAYEIANGLTPDCNGNAIPDSCDIASGVVADCDGNGVPDACDIAAGATDKDGDGVPDSCEYAKGDFDLNGEVGAPDLAVLLGLWGTVDPVVGDLDGDGEVGAPDLAILLGSWGPV